MVVDDLDYGNIHFVGNSIWSRTYNANFSKSYVVSHYSGVWTIPFYFELFSPLTPGKYDAQVRWVTENPQGNVIAEYVVYHADGQTAFSVSQQSDANQWNSLGIFNFSNEGSIRLLNGIVEDRTIDAIRFVPITGNSTCPLHDEDDNSIIDVGEIGTALNDWLTGTINMQELIQLMSYFKRGTCT